MSEVPPKRSNWLMRKHYELGWFGWFAYGLFLIAVVGMLVWVFVYAIGGGPRMAVTETLPFWLSGVGGPAALVAIYETSKRTSQVERSVVDMVAMKEGEGQKSGAQVAWKIEEKSGSKRRIVNIGTITAKDVHVDDVTNPKGQSGFSLLGDSLPRDVPVGDAIEATILRSIVDPYLSRIRIRWTEKTEKETYEAIYSVS